jgi:iron-sulfur cluster repair protein YtfE (RIC family)
MEGQRSFFRNVTEYLAWDHDGQEDLLIDARDAVDRGEVDVASGRLSEYELSLMRHMRIEERILFPLVASIASHMSAEIEEMRREHGEIRRALGAMRQAINTSDLVAFRHAYEALGRVLPAHEAREERLVYPVLDRSLSPEQRADLAARLAKES